MFHHDSMISRQKMFHHGQQFDTNGALCCFDCFYGRFGDQEVLLAINFDGENSNMTPRLFGYFSLYGLGFFLTKSLLEIARQ